MTTTKLTYLNVRRIDDADDPPDDVPDTCGMATPDGGECDRDPKYLFGLDVDGERKDGPIAACSGCFDPPDPSALPTTFSVTLTDSDLHA